MNPSPLAQLQLILQSTGLRAGLEFLNRRVPHRYTIVYKFDGDAFYGMVVVDKLGEPVPALFNKVPFDDSFCRYTVGEGVFSTACSPQDSRLDGHIHQANVQSYCGLPVTNPQGGLYGTFCHLDMVPQSLGDEEFAFLQEAAALLGGYLPETSELTGV
ncbi:GAF domain-containing protein [Variovorax sp. OK605]|jgi:GAF domain-containing protein|uniref:GAF domain-containing protein n=1 Tax=Variovorax sp. OK605 TaxID=1855317 RepID=UPI0008ECC087|nr:GAF domain-containing protein [Variovorax sp. OK605]SFQ75256.1 GAF domain-containing protein [Variovorax sp. OK605]